MRLCVPSLSRESEAERNSRPVAVASEPPLMAGPQTRLEVHAFTFFKSENGSTTDRSSHAELTQGQLMTRSSPCVLQENGRPC